MFARLTRSVMLEVLNQDYVRTARAKGLAEKLVIGKHALKNALIPLVTVAGMQFGFLIGGTVIIETVFAWPGVGRLVVQAIFSRDYPLVQAAVLVLAVIFVLVNLAGRPDLPLPRPAHQLPGGQVSPAAVRRNDSAHLRASLRLWGETLSALRRSPGAVAGGVLLVAHRADQPLVSVGLPQGPAGPGPDGPPDPARLAGGRQPRVPAGHRQPRPGRPGAHPLRQPREPAGGFRRGAGGLRGRHRAGTRLRVTTAAGWTA